MVMELQGHLHCDEGCSFFFHWEHLCYLFYFFNSANVKSNGSSTNPESNGSRFALLQAIRLAKLKRWSNIRADLQQIIVQFVPNITKLINYIKLEYSHH